ncbi:kinase-like protein [Cylindrobasidium torrendii FP15055 ss-10]|uniref:non-specific serine/threonine protein kinase n=1 Tax=Cylindrobasidium torrendii FP15055 ss-10 TaxID=1314674 RepID=A0A0D7BIJ8_9AGAR|nr:kinase-like protein [Cylindrobasidium torrendii FP15055 ss-10]
MANINDQYEPLDVIGNGSFGIIRKVRRKSDGLIFARKELDYERMNERDKKQIVAEVNILKELHNDHIVRYHDRYVDRDAGILYILMEYCGGGDLSSVIKQALKHNRSIPEDMIWLYFMQICRALYYCHHPNGTSHGRPSSVGGDNSDPSRRSQILHRDLKPDNVFLDEKNIVKLGDFGLSKALSHASFANTYVGTPYYMSPELMEEKAYDAKSDIWSLGCLIYELCALRPPFHEAQTHNELSLLIRGGRIPPLPKGYSSALFNVIKSMLNLNPAMRPSAAQLLQHERLELVYKVSETEKMLQAVKNHKQTVVSRERELVQREAGFQAREKALAEREAAMQSAVQEAIHKREQEFNVYLTSQLAAKELEFQKERENLIEQANAHCAQVLANRDADLQRSMQEHDQKWRELLASREEAYRKREQWIEQRESEIAEEQDQIERSRALYEKAVAEWEANNKAAPSQDRLQKSPLEEVKNVLEPLSRLGTHPVTPAPPKPVEMFAVGGSAMKGVVLTATGQVLATPLPPFKPTPYRQPTLSFANLRDTDEEHEENEVEASPSTRRRGRTTPIASVSSFGSASGSGTTGTTPTSSTTSTKAPTTRLRRPSLTRHDRAAGLSAAPLGHPHLKSPAPASYDMADEENLPSPFLKRTERAISVENLRSEGAKPVTKKRASGGNLLRQATTGSAIRRRPSTVDRDRPLSVGGSRKVNDEARKVLAKS